MTEEIRYKGFTAHGSDYDCSDGELAAVLGLVPDNVNGNGGVSLSPVQRAKTLFKLRNADSAVLFAHRGDRFTNYIIIDVSGTSLQGSKNNLYRSGRLSWTTNGSNLYDLYDLGSDGLYQVAALGNTLMLLTTSGVKYFLWEQAKSTYKHLGSEIPGISIRFGLQGSLERSDKLDVSIVNFDENVKKAWEPFLTERLNGKSTLRLKIRESEKKEITDYVLGYVNKFIAENYEKKGKFIYPFFVRYAYRLYDGSLTKHSAPILMIPSTNCSPACVEEGTNFYKTGDKVFFEEKKVNYRIVGMTCDLDYMVQSDLSKLKDWRDIVKSVDVYVSAPVYTYNQNGDVEYLNITPISSSDMRNTKSACSLVGVQESDEYSEWDWYEAYSRKYQPTITPPNADIMFKASLELPKVSSKTVVENIKTCRDFYLLRSINIEELVAHSRKTIDIDEYFFRSLVNRQHMTDDYDSHDKLTAKAAFVYNQRLNLTGLTKSLFRGFSPADVNTLVNSSIIKALSFRPIKVRAYVFIKQAGREIVVESDVSEAFYTVPFYYFYYPNANAYKAVIRVQGAWKQGAWDSTAERHFELSLESHIGLNGAFWFGDFRTLGEMEESWRGIPDTSNIDTTIDIKSKIYTSKVNNPFVFPVLGITTVGVGEIYGISTAAKALSEGQFGQFPLYAFTSDGVWALEVASNGAYSARQPITRDVCVDKDSITQIDSAVLFATERGIMLLSGAQSTCISDVLDGEVPFALNTLPHGEDIVRLADLQDNQFEYVRFKDYIKDSGMIYDYSHQRIVLFNPAKVHAYVYSLNTKMWGIMESSIVHGVNSYPQALAMNSDGSLTDLSSYDNTEETKVLFVTRPLKFGAANVLKTIESVIQRGRFTNGNIKTVLYGSRNLETWSLVWSSEDHYLRGFSGSPYKYYRIVGFGSLSVGYSIGGASISIRGRFNNQLR